MISWTTWTSTGSTSTTSTGAPTTRRLTSRPVAAGSAPGSSTRTRASTSPGRWTSTPWPSATSSTGATTSSSSSSIIFSGSVRSRYPDAVLDLNTYYWPAAEWSQGHPIASLRLHEVGGHSFVETFPAPHRYLREPGFVGQGAARIGDPVRALPRSLGTAEGVRSGAVPKGARSGGLRCGGHGPRAAPPAGSPSPAASSRGATFSSTRTPTGGCSTG